MTISVFSAADGSYGTISLNGSEKLRLNADGSATLGGAPVQRMLSLGTKATTSGTSIDFSPADGTGIPSWAKKITILFNQVGTPGVVGVRVQFFTNGVLTTGGYTSTACYLSSWQVPVTASHTTGVWVFGSGAATLLNGSCTLDNVAGNTWVASGTVQRVNDGACQISAGQIPLTGVATGIRIEAVSGSFDAGSISVVVEG